VLARVRPTIDAEFVNNRTVYLPPVSVLKAVYYGAHQGILPSLTEARSSSVATAAR
jgi:hypothetical protein